MENVINKILEIDKEACCRLESAKEKQKQILCDAKLEEARIKDDNIKKADDRVEKVDKYESEVSEEKIAVILDQKQQKLSKLQAIYDENHISWEQDILQRIVGD